MRKLLSILLLAVIGLPFATPLLAATGKSEANLPACCRRNGTHHCMMKAGVKKQLQESKPAFRTPFEKCPYTAATVIPSHHFAPAVSIAEASFAEIVHHPAIHAQTEAKRRVSRDRSRSERGPPTLSLV